MTDYAAENEDDNVKNQQIENKLTLEISSKNMMDQRQKNKENSALLIEKLYK